MFSFLSHKNCLLWTSICVTKSINWPLRDIEMKSTSDAIFTFRREQNISFSLYKRGTDARRLHYFLEQGIEMCGIFSDSLVECRWEDDVLLRTPRAAMIIVRVGCWIHQYLKGPGKRGHIVADTKCFWTKAETFFVSATNVARAGKRGNICVGNNVSTTMCPRLPGPWRVNVISHRR